MHLPALHLLIPDWSLPWLVLAAAIAFLAGAMRLSLTLGSIPVIKLVVGPALVPLVGTVLPIWALPSAAALCGLLALHGLIGLVFGREAAGQFTGSVLVALCLLVLKAPLAGMRGGAKLLAVRRLFR